MPDNSKHEEVLDQIVEKDVLLQLFGLAKHSRCPIFLSSALVLLQRCFHAGISPTMGRRKILLLKLGWITGLSATYYEKALHGELYQLLVDPSPSLEQKAFAIQCLQHALLAFRTPSWC